MRWASVCKLDRRGTILSRVIYRLSPDSTEPIPVALTGLNEGTPAAIDALRPVQSVLVSIGTTVFQPSTYPPGADIAEMSDAGVPAFGVMQDGRTYFCYHHSAADTLDKVVPTELRENAAAMAVLAYALANMKDPLPR